MRKARTRPLPTTFYEMANEVLTIYRRRLLRLPRRPMEDALLDGKGLGGIYLMYDRGCLWNIGKTVDLQARLNEYLSLWRSKGTPLRIIENHEVAFLAFPPKAEQPHGLWKRDLYRLEWFVQLAFGLADSMNALYREDPGLFRVRRARQTGRRDGGLK